MTEQRSLSVSEAMGLARGALESVRVRVIGEISEISDKPGYKAAYFTLADAGASMSCLMWRDAYSASGVTLRAGMQVEVAGQFSAYVPKGRMQFVVRSLSLAGEGVLRMRVAEIARRLQAEGLLEPSRKRPLPHHPLRIAVVTSPRGKAIHDVLRTLRRRYPIAEVLVAGVPVEGEGAPQALVEGLSAAQAARPDVILLVRGGGSYEDLMPFNSEQLARAIAACAVPVVTGIGHEPDNSIADMVSDVRASTPTAAAEAASPDIGELKVALSRDGRRLGRGLAHAAERFAARLSVVAGSRALVDPGSLYAAQAQAVDFARMRLERAIPAGITAAGVRTDDLRTRMASVGSRMLDGFRGHRDLLASRLEDLSPLKILGRGYALAVGDASGSVIRSTDDVELGDAVTLRVADGRIGCTVSSVHKEGR